MEARNVDLSVVVVTHNGRDLALRTLRSARRAARGLRVEWFVVDSGSQDGTADAVAEEFPDVDVTRADNRGFAGGNNIALARARGRYVLLLNPDVEVRSGTLRELVGALDARPSVGAASVIQRGTDGELQHSIRRFPSPARKFGEAIFAERWPGLRRCQELETDPRAYDHEHSIDWAVGAFLIVRSQAAKQVGAMDERFFLYSEETDWCYRIREAGWDIRHLPVMTVTHHCGGYARPELAAQLTYSKLLFARKHFGRFRSSGIRAALALRHGLRVAMLWPRAAKSGDRTRLDGERRALGIVFGDPPPFTRDQDGAIAPAARS